MQKERFEVDGYSGIINKEFFHKRTRKREGYNFISDDRFEQLTISARKRGAIILRGGEEVEAHLDYYGAGASNLGDILFFREEVTISEVLEEVYHLEQNRRGDNSDKEAKIMTIMNEIDAKKYVLSVADKYNIPRKEIEETRNQLEEYERKLRETED